MALNEEKLQQQIDELIGKIKLHDFPASSFTVDAVITQCFLFVSQFCKIARCLTPYDSDQQWAIFQIGVKHGFFPDVSQCYPGPFVSFCQFLKSSDGQKALQSELQRLKLQRKLKRSDESDEDVALATMLFIQYSDYRAHVKALRRSKIADLEDSMAKAKGLFQPSSSYELISREEMQGKCYEMYVEMACALNKAVLPRDNGGLERAVEMYGADVPRRRRSEFASRPENRMLLQQYFLDKAKQMEADGLIRKANTFRNYLAILDVEVPAKKARRV